MEEITVAIVVNLNSSKLEIPNSWIKKLSEDDKFAILLKNNPGMFRLITTRHDSVTEYYLDLETLAEDFLEILFKTFENMKLKPLYSSGVCFVDDSCYYLFLLDGYHSQEQVDMVVDKFENLQGIKKVEVKFHKLE